MQLNFYNSKIIFVVSLPRKFILFFNSNSIFNNAIKELYDDCGTFKYVKEKSFKMRRIVMRRTLSRSLKE